MAHLWGFVMSFTSSTIKIYQRIEVFALARFSIWDWRPWPMIARPGMLCKPNGYAAMFFIVWLMLSRLVWLNVENTWTYMKIHDSGKLVVPGCTLRSCSYGAWLCHKGGVKWMHEHILCPQQGLAISSISNVVLVHPGHKVAKVTGCGLVGSGRDVCHCLPLAYGINASHWPTMLCKWCSEFEDWLCSERAASLCTKLPFTLQAPRARKCFQPLRV